MNPFNTHAERTGHTPGQPVHPYITTAFANVCEKNNTPPTPLPPFFTEAGAVPDRDKGAQITALLWRKLMIP
jgi:hypothetical protein